MLSKLQVRCQKQTQTIARLKSKNEELANMLVLLQKHFRVTHTELALIIYQKL